jgi:hypothetical protein
MGSQYERAAATPAQPAQRIERFFQASLLGLLASGFLALAFSGYLDSATIGLTVVGLLARAVVVFGDFRDLQFSPRAANALTLAYIGFYPIDYLYLSKEFIPATVHLVCFLSVIRILSARTNRDYFFVKVLAFLELLGATLLSSNISFFVFLTMFLVFGVATLCCSEIRRSSQQPNRIAMPRANFHFRLAAITAGITLGIMLMTVGLFVLLPRTARVAFRSLIPEKYHVTGFANEVSLGQLGQIQQSSAPMLHVLIDGVHQHLPLKWRGGALSQFDGKRWYNPPGQNQTIRVDHGLAILADENQRRRLGQRIAYQVRVDSADADALFFAGVPEFVQTNLPILLRTPQGAFRTGRGFGAASQYAATSFRPETETTPYLVPPLPADVATEYLLLPNLDRRIVDLARNLDHGGTTPDRARVFEQYLRTNYSYTTELLKQEVPDPLANFLFERRAGHCEYFASAMAVMLRAVHIPSRVVTGFQSGVYNPMTGWHVLRASDAHSWVEAWAPGHGWMTFDPTPPANSPQGKPWSTLALYLDAGEMWWQRWVMDYDLDHQLYLASRFEQSTRGWKGISTQGWLKGLLPAVLGFFDRTKNVILTSGAALIFGVLLWSFLPSLIDAIRRQYHLRRIRQEGAGASDAALLYMRMLDILRKRGYEKPGWLTPTEFASVIPESRTATLVQEFTALYQQLRYGNTRVPGDRMLVLLDELGGVKRR